MSRESIGPERDGMTQAELLALPAVVSITTAAQALGLGRSTAYELARRDEFPCRILHIGSSYRVPTAELLRILGIDPASNTNRPLTSDARSRRLPGLNGPAPPHEGRTP